MAQIDLKQLPFPDHEDDNEENQEWKDELIRALQENLEVLQNALNDHENRITTLEP